MRLNAINENTPAKYVYNDGYKDGRIETLNQIKELVINMINDIPQGETTKNIHIMQLGYESAFHRVIEAIKGLE